MANSVLSKGSETKTVVAGSTLEKNLLAKGWKKGAGSPEQGNSTMSIMAAVSANKREIAVDPSTDLAQLRKELEEGGKMATGASVPAIAVVGPCDSATCVKPTRLVKSSASQLYYFREDFEVVDGEGNEFKAFCLNNGTFVDVGESADVSVVDGVATRTGKGLAYTIAE